ncbi:MAG: helix-turn-helix domain-containing protein [Bacteroidota bacterium]
MLHTDIIGHLVNLHFFSSYKATGIATYEMYLRNIGQYEEHQITVGIDVLTEKINKIADDYPHLKKPQPLSKLRDFINDIPEINKIINVRPAITKQYITLATNVIADDFFDMLIEKEKQHTPFVSEPNTVSSKELLTRIEAAKLLSVTPRTVDQWIEKGKLTAYAIGGRKYLKRTEIIKSLTQIS